MSTRAALPVPLRPSPPRAIPPTNWLVGCRFAQNQTKGFDANIARTAQISRSIRKFSHQVSGGLTPGAGAVSPKRGRCRI